MNARRSRPRIWHTDWLILKPLAAILDDQLRQHLRPPATVIDFGCGDMPYKMLIERSGFKYVGADIGPGADLVIDSSGKLPLAAQSVDSVISIQVLEHVRDLDTYCGEIHRVLVNDGTLFLSTHGTWLYHPHPEDHRRWTSTGLDSELASRGLYVKERIAIAGPLATTTIIRLTGYVFILRKIPVIGPALAGMLSIIMNIRGWIEDAITPVGMRDNNACIYFVRASKVS